jgi:hypothetical protein
MRRHALVLSFVIIIGVFFAFGSVTTKNMVLLGDLTRTIYDHPLVVSNAALNAALNITKMHGSMKDVVLSTSAEELQTALAAVAESERAVMEQLDLVRANILGEEGESLEQQTRSLFISWKPIREEVIDLLEAGRGPAAIAITKGKAASHVAMLEAKMLDLTAYARSKATGFLRLAEVRQSRLEMVTALFTALGVTLAALIAVMATYRVVNTEKILVAEKDKLQKALDEIKTLRGIIPICSHCKKIRDDEGLWKQLEVYIKAHSEADFSHGICPACLKKYYPAEYAAMHDNGTV